MNIRNCQTRSRKPTRTPYVIASAKTSHQLRHKKFINLCALVKMVSCIHFSSMLPHLPSWEYGIMQIAPILTSCKRCRAGHILWTMKMEHIPVWKIMRKSMALRQESSHRKMLSMKQQPKVCVGCKLKIPRKGSAGMVEIVENTGTLE